MTRELTLCELKTELMDKRPASFGYVSGDQPAPTTNCCYDLSFTEMLVDEFLCVVGLRGSGGSMSLYGVRGAELSADDDSSCATLTIKCRENRTNSRQVRYIFKTVV